MENALVQCRDQIDRIDAQLMALFEERMNVVLGVARYKEANNMPIFHKQREIEVIAKNIARLENKELAPYADDFLHSLMDVSKNYQCDAMGLREVPLGKSGEVTIGFQGVPGSFSEEALLHYFGADYETHHYKSFEDVFEALKYEHVQYGILPIENSSTGSITQVYDLLKKYGFYIVGETRIKIEHHLLGLQGAKINGLTSVYSHEQGLEQSSDYLRTLPQCQQIPYHNTAMSAKFVKDSQDETKAAIGSRRAAEIYGLEILKPAINNAKENVTRFIIVGKQPESNMLCDKMTLVFTLPNEAGSLYEQLTTFAKEGINLLKIESRPVGDGSFSYFFYLDVEGNSEDEKIKSVIGLLTKQTQEFRVLGCYKKSE